MAKPTHDFSRFNHEDDDAADSHFVGVQGVGEEVAALPFLLEDYAGIATYRGKPIFTQEQVIAQIDAGVEFKGKTITFTFLDGPHTIGIYNNPRYGFAEPEGYSPFSAAEKAVTRESMQLWDDLIAPKIVEKNGNGADIVFANTTTGPAQAWAYYPGQGLKIYSDVWTAATGGRRSSTKRATRSV
jgi:serralysin